MFDPLSLETPTANTAASDKLDNVFDWSAYQFLYI